MPATLLSHQALVLPLKMRWPHRFSGLALCLGSMAPDLEFIGRMTDDWLFSHTLSAQVWFTVPLSLMLVWILTRLLVPTLLPYLREVAWLRLHDVAAIEAPRGMRGWCVAAFSAWVGGMSHVVLDGITHGNHSGWLVPWLPILRTPVPHLSGPVPLYDSLQCWLTLLLGVAAIWQWRTISRQRLLWRWRARVAQPAQRMPRASGLQLGAVCAVAAVQGGLLGRAMHSGANPKAMTAAVAFGAIDFLFVAVVVSAAVLRARYVSSCAFRVQSQPS